MSIYLEARLNRAVTGRAKPRLLENAASRRSRAAFGIISILSMSKLPKVSRRRTRGVRWATVSQGSQ